MRITKIQSQNKGVYFLLVDGLLAAQSFKVEGFLLQLSKESPRIVIEIGTCRGGFAMLLRKYFAGSEIFTFDIKEWEPVNLKRTLFDDYHINFVNEDCFVSRKLEGLLSDPRKKIVFCDGPRKADEFNTFKQMINEGDLIGVHDYFEDKEDYDEKVWTTCETTLDVLDTSDLTRCYKRSTKSSVWAMFRKNG